ncbi:hypothetical protein PVL29_007997 [Vitis rotundifolia]|uniref:Annexin n=1 Tax=Vitis rotundifolia TaxID=103349 RepID=A0AA39A2E2_VITRO|nr:hypothetical protein PVL29_007997 [Vitis rotundifolia]
MATLVAPEDFSPGEDALAINKACQGWGTDEKAIILILGHRNAAQRKQIRLAYQEIYLKDLTKQLKSELSGDFERAVCHWILDPVERDAVLANEALKKARPDYRVILETAYMKSPEELLAVKRTYQFLYKRSLEEDVASHTTGDMRRLLIAVVSVYRYEGEEIDEGVAHSEANILGDEIQGGALKGEEIIRILSTRSKTQLIATFNNYKQIHGTSITKLLCNTINNMGTDEDTLSRVIITRAEKDLKEMKELYLERNSRSLDDAVSSETTGDYKAFLLTLLGNQEF